jgi:hypothetical protein
MSWLPHYPSTDKQLKEHPLTRFWNVIPRRSDEEVRCAGISNPYHRQKFTELFFLGGWKKWGYTSPSEADQGFVNIVAKHTNSPQQVARIWRASRLAQLPGREKKLRRDDYLFHERYGIVTRAFDRK